MPSRTLRDHRPSFGPQPKLNWTLRDTSNALEITRPSAEVEWPQGRPIEETHHDDRVRLFSGDALDLLSVREQLPAIQSVITSPTYWGKRQFTTDQREFGREPLEQYLDKCVKLFGGLLDIVADTGSLFFVMQDSRMGSGISRSQHFSDEFFKANPGWKRNGNSKEVHGNTSKVTARHDVIENTSWCGIPFRIANRLVDAGYIWRDYIIWDKPNPMPDKIVNRTRQSAEYIFHFVKSRTYLFHPEAISVPGKSGRLRPMNQVWTDVPHAEKIHSATFPPSLVERLMNATTNPGDWVMDPFLGSGTTLKVALKNGRRVVGCDLNPEFVRLARGFVDPAALGDNLFAYDSV